MNLLCRFLDHWDSFWGTWWPTIDWGNAPSWVGSILTSASVSLAFLILWRDRSDKRRAQADGMTIWFQRDRETTKAGDFWKYTIKGYNAGASPVPNVAFVYYDDKLPKLLQMRDAATSESVISPQGKAIGFAMAQIGDHQFRRQVYAMIRDSSNRLWVRDLDTGTYISVKRFTKFRTAKLKPIRKKEE